MKCDIEFEVIIFVGNILNVCVKGKVKCIYICNRFWNIMEKYINGDFIFEGMCVVNI